jgi:DMSO reductase anchor subunit
LSASLLHLGRPWLAFRAVLGLRHSWLSREILAFGLFAKLAMAYAALLLLFPNADPRLAEALGWSVAASGLLGVFCSVMIYVVTDRECWSPLRVGIRFFGTSAVLGVATLWLSLLLVAVLFPGAEIERFVTANAVLLGRALALCGGAKLLWEVAGFRHLLERRMTAMRRSAILMIRELPRITLLRFSAGALGGLLMPLCMVTGAANTPGSFAAAVVILFAGCVVGELCERALFFSACAAPRMPGGIR